MDFNVSSTHDDSSRAGSLSLRKPRVRLFIRGMFAVADPALPAPLVRLLEVEHSRYGTDSDGAIRGRKKLLKFHGLDAAGIAWFYAGLVPTIEAALARVGHPVEVVDQTLPRERVGLDHATVAGLHDREANLVRGMAANRHGLIEAGRLEDRVAVVAATARAFPGARIAVTSASRSAAVAFVDRLRPRLDEPVVLFHKHGYVLSPVRIQVCTWGSLYEPGSDIIFFVEAADALSSRYLKSFTQFQNQHVYGFVPPDRRLHARDRLGLEALFGPVICRERSTAAVGVIFAQVPEIAIPGQVVGLERKRRAVWHNERRNAVVAGVANALATGDAEALGRHGLACNGPAVAEADPGGPHVVILVESPEHGRELARRLPGWSLLDATRPSTSVFLEDKDKAPDLPRRSIVTMLGARRLDRLEVDILVRGDGSPWPLELAGFPPRAGHGRASRVLVVDLDDGDGAARRRLDDYQGRGWEVEGANLAPRDRRRPGDGGGFDPGVEGIRQ
jgi:hypothetical protein